MGELITFTPSQISLIRRTVAKDANSNEFDTYLEMCKARGLNPLLRHCYCFIFHKDKADKRQMVIVISIDGQRSLAGRSGNYRADEKAPRYEIDAALKDPATNPAGLISAEVTVYKFSHGAWFPVTAQAWWEESAPLSQIWENGQPTDKYRLDPKKDGWRKMPRLMLAKVAEMAALRKAFPDDFSGLYGEAEMDRGEVLDLSPSEWAEKADQEERLKQIGGQALTIDWMDGNELQRVPIGKFYDAAMSFLRTCDGQPATVDAWRGRNRHALQEFWALDKAAALNLKKTIEGALSAPMIEAVDEPKLILPDDKAGRIESARQTMRQIEGARI